MPDEQAKIGRADADDEAKARGYEARDINIRAIVVLLGGFAVVFAVLCGGLWAMRQVLMNRPVPAVGTRSVVERNTVPTDAPPLQPQVGHPALDNWDLTAMRAREDKTFETFGWRRDARTHRYVVPATVLATLRSRQSSTRPTTMATASSERSR